MQTVDRLLLCLQIGIGRRQLARNQDARHFEGTIAWCLGGGKAPQGARGQNDHEQARKDRQVELKVEASHVASVLLLGKDVAGAAYRDDAAWPLHIVLDGRADARDVHIHGAVERLQRLGLHQIHQHLA